MTKNCLVRIGKENKKERKREREEIDAGCEAPTNLTLVLMHCYLFSFTVGTNFYFVVWITTCRVTISSSGGVLVRQLPAIENIQCYTILPHITFKKTQMLHYLCAWPVMFTQTERIHSSCRSRVHGRGRIHDKDAPFVYAFVDVSSVPLCLATPYARTHKYSTVRRSNPALRATST